MGDDEARKVHVHVESHEGTMFYTDDRGRDQWRVMGSIVISTLVDQHGQGQICWWHAGTPGMLAEGIARFLVNTPGMMEAVQGMFLRELKTRGGGG